MPKIYSKGLKVKDANGIWHDLPTVVSEESMRAAEDARASSAAAEQSAAAAEAAAEYASQWPAYEAMEAAQRAAVSAEDAAHSLAVVEGQFPEGIATTVTEWLEDNVDPVGSAVTVDSSLLIEGSAADAKETGDNLKHNTHRVFRYDTAAASATSNSVVWEWSNNILTFSGTTSSGSNYYYYDNTSALPEGIVPGETYFVDYETTDPRVCAKIDFYVGGTAKYTFSFRKGRAMTVPKDVTGARISERIGGGSSVTVDGSVTRFDILKTEMPIDLDAIEKKADNHGVYEIALTWHQGFSSIYANGPLTVQAPAALNQYAATDIVKMPASGIYEYSDVNYSLKLHFWKYDANLGIVPATDYPYYHGSTTAAVRENHSSYARYYPYAENVYFNVSIYRPAGISASDAERNVHIFAGEIKENNGRLPNLSSCGICGLYAAGVYENQSLFFEPNYGVRTPSAGVSVNTIDYRNKCYVAAIRLQDVDRIIFAPPYSGVARIYKIDDDEQEINLYEEIFPYIAGYSGAAVMSVCGKSVLDFRHYDFKGFALIGVVMEVNEYVTSTPSLWYNVQSNGFLKKYDDAMKHVFVEWKPNVGVQYDYGVPASAKLNIDTVLNKMFAPDMKASLDDGGYGNWIYSGNNSFAEKGEVHGWWYNGGNCYNVPHMHVTPKSYITASKNRHSRVYVSADHTGDGHNNMYGGVCSSMAAFVCGRPIGIETMMYASRQIPGMEYRDMVEFDDIRPGDIVAGIGQGEDVVTSYGHVQYATEVVAVNGEEMCLNVFEGAMPWCGFRSYLNLGAYDGYEIEDVSGETTNILYYFSSRYFTDKFAKFEIARMPAKDYKTVRNVYGPYDTQDYEVTEIMCDRGTDSVYCIGEPMTLCVTDGTTSIDLYKNGTLLKSVDLTDYPVETYTDGKVYDVTGMIDAAGYYEIYVSNDKKESFFVPTNKYLTMERDDVSVEDPKITIHFDPDEEDDEIVAFSVWYYTEDSGTYPRPYFDFDAETVDGEGHGTLIVPRNITLFDDVSRRGIYVGMIRRTPYGTYTAYRWFDTPGKSFLQRAGRPVEE